MGAQNPTQTNPWTSQGPFSAFRRAGAIFNGQLPTQQDFQKMRQAPVTSPANPNLNPAIATQGKFQNPIIAPVRTGPASPFTQDPYQRFMY